MSARNQMDSSGVRMALQGGADDRPEEKKNKKPERETEQNSKDRASQEVPCTCTCTCRHCSSNPCRSRAEGRGHAEKGDLMSFSTPTSTSTGAEGRGHAEKEDLISFSTPTSTSTGAEGRGHAKEDDKSKCSCPSKPSSYGSESRSPKEEGSPKLWSTSAPSSGRGESWRHAEEDDKSKCSCPSKPSSYGAESRSPKEEGSLMSWRPAEETEPMDWDYSMSLCCKLDDLKRLPECHQNLRPLNFSKTHAVLINVDFFRNGGVIPQEGKDMWDSKFVKMPCSPESFVAKSGKKVKRWDEMSDRLRSLAKKTKVTAKDVEEAIIRCNPRYKGEWRFDALYDFDRFVPEYQKLFPKIARLALKLPEQVKKAIPLLRRGQSASITLSRGQIACLLANAFFCTFPHRNTTSPKAEYHGFPSINFSSLFGFSSHRKIEKLKAIMHYFRVVTDDKTDLSGLVTFERRCDTDRHNWESCKETMPKLHVTSSGTIETEGTGMLQVDFACSSIGGGVLNSGLVQEEILFIISPELIVSRLFTEKLDDNECLIITGTQQFSKYSGFSDSFKWTGEHEDRLKKDEWGRLQRQILAIDALNFKYSGEQYDMYKVRRELNKAYCGFKGQGDEPDIATGKWGCGAFNGDAQLKAVIQLMAAAKARRGLAFFTFGDYMLKERLEQIYSLLVREKITVDKLFKLLKDFCDQQQSRRGSHLELFDFIRKKIEPSRSRM